MKRLKGRSFLLSSMSKLSLKLCVYVFFIFIFPSFFVHSLIHSHTHTVIRTHAQQQKHSHTHSIETIQCSWTDRINWIILNRKQSTSPYLTASASLPSATSKELMYDFDWRRASERKISCNASFFNASDRVKRARASQWIQYIRRNRFWGSVFNVAPCQSIFYYYCCCILNIAGIAATDIITALYVFSARLHTTYIDTKRLKWHTHTHTCSQNNGIPIHSFLSRSFALSHFIRGGWQVGSQL